MYIKEDSVKNKKYIDLNNALNNINVLKVFLKDISKELYILSIIEFYIYKNVIDFFFMEFFSSVESFIKHS